MKPSHCVFLSVCMSLLFMSCNKENAPDLFKSTGEKTTVTKYLNGYHKITVFDHIEIELKQSNEYKAEITGGKNLIPKINFDITDSILTIKNKNTANWVRDYKKDDIKVTLYIPNTERLRIEQYGSGRIYTADTLKIKEIAVDMQSSGDIDLTVNCRGFICVQFRRNYGNMKVKGKSTQVINVNDGTGEFNSLGLDCQYARIETVNKGDSYAYVPGPVKVRIMDTGNIYLSGNPAPVEWIEKKGSGSLILR